MSVRLSRILAAVVMLVGAIAVHVADPPLAGAAVSFTVTSTADAGDADPGDGECDAGGGDCTLRAAVEEGNALDDNVAISVPSGSFDVGDDSLDLASDRTFTITGAGETATVLRGDRVFDVTGGSTLVLRDLDIAHATDTAVVVDSSSLEATAVTFRDNTVTGAYQPAVLLADASTIRLASVTVRNNVTMPLDTDEPHTGNIYNLDGDLTVSDSTFRDNSAICCGAVISTRAETSAATTTITGGLFTGNAGPDCCGGALLNAAYNGNTSTLSVDASVFIDNSAAGCCGVIANWDGSGGSAIADVTNSEFTGGDADGCCGGAIYNGGVMVVSGSNFANNTAKNCCGGAIHNYGVMDIDTSTFVGNGVQNCCGGAIGNYGTMTLTASSVRGNAVDDHPNPASSCCGGGIENAGDLDIVDSTVADNWARDGYGGGILHYGGALRITGSTISGNRSNTDGTFVSNGGGGGLSVTGGTAHLANTTVSANQAIGTGQQGGGILVTGGTVTLVNVTVADNDADDGGGIHHSGGSVTLSNTIVAENTDANCAGGVTSAGHNLDDDGTCGLTQFGDLSDATAGLGALSDNGGPTHTHALSSASNARVAGNTAVCAASPINAVDQRGVERGAPACDIGAFEATVAPTAVFVEASVARAAEGGRAGVYRFTRTGSVAAALSVEYSVRGTATSGEDFTPLGTVAFQPGEATVTADVVAVADGIEEPAESVIVTVRDADGYVARAPMSATVWIWDRFPPDPDPCLDVGDAGFVDVTDANVHREAIDCLQSLGITEGGPAGLPADQYGPGLDVTRGQIASFLARLIDTAGVDLPTDPPDAFDDDDGHAHEANIDALVAAGVIEGLPDGRFGPNLPVRRGQMASLLARTDAFVAGQALEPGDDAFVDDDGIVHEDAINALAAAGVVRGTAVPGIYDPSGDVRRDQMASFLVRLAQFLAAEGQFLVE
ncbi:MAG: S-layer homology domain-containing protein [Acidimicrobiales bacterium]